jgi:hypothetical protein
MEVNEPQAYVHTDFTITDITTGIRNFVSGMFLWQ